MLPAEKTHYRKGLALGLTLAETFSVVVFILLIVCAVLLRLESSQREDAEASLEDARVDLRITQEMLALDTNDWGSATRWYEYARKLRAHIDSLESMIDLAGSEEAPEKGGSSQPFAALRDSLQKRLTAAEEIVRQIRDQVADNAGLDPEEANQVIHEAAQASALRDSLAILRDTISSLDRELGRVEEQAAADSTSQITSIRDSLRSSRHQEDILTGELNDVRRERDEAIGRARYREAELERYRTGSGIDPPPCWLNSEFRPEYIFRIELTQEGMRLFNISPPHRGTSDVEAFRHAERIEDGREYGPAEFLRLTLPFYRLGVSRTESFGPTGCRFWIQPVDRTGDQKGVFIERRDQLSRRFWFRWGASD